MRPSIFVSGATCALLFARTAGAQAVPPALTDADYLKLGKHFTEWFFTGQTDSLLSHMAPETQLALKGAEGILETRDQVAARAGAEKKVTEERMTRRRGNPQFWHQGEFENLSEPLVLRWVMNPRGQIIGVGMGPLSQTPPEDPPVSATAAVPAMPTKP